MFTALTVSIRSFGAPTAAQQGNRMGLGEAVLVEMTLFRNLCDRTGRRHADLVLKLKARGSPRYIVVIGMLVPSPVWPQALPPYLSKFQI